MIGEAATSLRDAIIAALRAHQREIQSFGVASLVLFGSFARNQARADSDVDLLVTFAGPPTFDRFMDLKFYLEDLLGRRVDLVTAAALKPRLEPMVEREAIRVA